MTVPGTINSSTGVFTAATTDGTYPGAIEAAVGAVTGTATVVVAAANGWRQHEPAGMTQLIDSPFNTVATSAGGTAEGWTTAFSTNWSQVSDATAPVSPPNVGRMTYTTSQPYGSAPNTLTSATIGGSYTKLYACMALKLSSNYYGPGGQKLFFIYGGNGSSPLPSLILELKCPQDTTSNIYPEVYGENTGNDSWYISSSTADLVSRGNWHIYEVYCELNDPGVNNGLLKFWIDGTEYDKGSAVAGAPGDGNCTQFNLIPAGNTKQFYNVNLSPTYGGGGTPQSPPATQTIDFDEIYVSVG